MKIKIINILLVMVVVLMTACSNDPTNGKSPAPSDITDAIIESGDFEELIDIQSDRLKDFYNIDESLLESYSVRVCVSGGNADEVAVFKAVSSDKIELIKTAVSERKARRMSDFDGYRPEEYKKVKDCAVKSIGPYVLFAVGDDTDAAVSIFDDFFKK